MAVCHSCVVGAFHKNEAFSLSSCVYAAVLTVQGVFGLGFGDWICVAFW